MSSWWTCTDSSLAACGMGTQCKRWGVLGMGFWLAARRDAGGGAGRDILARQEGQDGSGQLSSNGDWPESVARIHALLQEAHSDVGSNADGACSAPDSRLGSLVAGPGSSGQLASVGEEGSSPKQQQPPERRSGLPPQPPPQPAAAADAHRGAAAHPS